MSVRPEELAATLCRRRAVRFAAEQQRARDIRLRLWAAMQEAQRDKLIEHAWLIGSLAHGSFGAGSDVDVVVQGLALPDLGVLYGKLVECLGTEVDLLRLEELPGSFRARVYQEGERIDVR